MPLLSLEFIPQTSLSDGPLAVLVADLRLSLGFIPQTSLSGVAADNLRSEDAFRTLLQSLLLQMGRPTQSEKSTLGGRADHEIPLGHRMYVFEVKYNRSLGAPRRQIRDRPYGREHLGRGWEVVAVSLNLRRNPDGIALECATDALGELLGVREEPRHH